MASERFFLFLLLLRSARLVHDEMAKKEKKGLERDGAMMPMR